MVKHHRGVKWAVAALVFAVASANVARGDSADSITAGITAKAGQPQDYTADNSTRGRENKAKQSQNGSNTGAVIAAIAGAALVAAAVPKLASGFPPTVAVGAALMAKAGIEFAQSAASAKTGQSNGGQYDRLTLAYDESRGNVGAQGSTDMQSQIAQTLASNPDLKSVLDSKGVDSNQFIQQLASGQLSSTDQVLTAVKNDLPIDGNTIAQADAAATAQTTQAIGDAATKVQLQEGSQTTALAQVSANESGAGGGTTMMASGGGKSSVTDGGDKKGLDAQGDRHDPQGARTPAALAQAGRDGGATKTNAGGALGLGGIEDELMEKWMAGFGGGDAKKKREETAVSEKEMDPLLALGVRHPVGKMTLFQLAHRNYRAYREWRYRKALAGRARDAKAKGTLALKEASVRR